MYAEKRLETLFPTGSTSRIEGVQAFAVDVTDLDPDPDVPIALSGAGPLADPTSRRVREHCIATVDTECYAVAREVFPGLSIKVAEDGHDVAELARLYLTVVVLDESFIDIGVDGDVRVLPDAAEWTDEVVPERLLVSFAANREALGAAAAVHGVAELDPLCDLAALRGILPRLADDGAVFGDDEFKCLSNAVDDLDTAVSAAESTANDRLRDVIREHDVTTEGTDFLSLVEQGTRVDSLLSCGFEGEFDGALSVVHNHLIESLSLRPDEADLTEWVLPDDPPFPFGHDEEAVGRLRIELRAVRGRRTVKLKAGLAANLGNLCGPVKTLVRDTLELDIRLAILRFVRGFGCVFPELTGAARNDSAGSFVTETGRSPLLDVDFPDADPVDYEVSSATLLSGANSGNETSTPDLVGPVVVLVHVGFPVPAESVRLSRFSELHYYAKPQRTLDAGAFESTLRDFVVPADGAADRPVLVDELESITEPDASAKIITGILEELAERGVAAVLVSHLAGGIREAVDVSIAVNGIEAAGLEDGELVVNHSSMKDHLARSTPELTVEKLVSENETSFYGRLLEKFS